MSVSQWLKNNTKIAQSNQSGSWSYGQEDNEIFAELEDLHRQWYTIQQLENKYSALAEKAKEEAKANFHMKASDIANKFNKRFSLWLDMHRMPGWWNRAKAHLTENYEGYIASKERDPYRYRSESKFDIESFHIPQQMINILGQRYSHEVLANMQDIEVEEMVRDHHMVHGAYEYLKTTGQIVDGVNDDETAFEHIQTDDNLQADYAQHLKKTTDFAENFDPVNIYGSNWYEELPQEFLEQLNKSDDLGPMAYAKFIQRWPNYIQVANNVESSLQRLRAATSNPEDYNGVMTAISLALNTAHNSGIMSDHVGLSRSEMTDLSNLNMQDIDQKSTRYMSWLRENCRFAK